MADDLSSRVAVLESRDEEHTRRLSDSEDRLTVSIDKAEGRLKDRVEKVEKNLLWVVLLVVAAVISKVLEKIGLG